MPTSFCREIPGLPWKAFCLWLGCLVAACQQPGPEPPPEPGDPPPTGSQPAEVVEAPPPAQDLEDARRLVAEGDLNGALNLLDDLRADSRENPDYWLLFGQTTLDFALLRRAQGERDGGLLQSLFLDAAQAFERAGEGGAPELEVALGTMRARYQGNQLQEAWQAAERLWSRLPAPPPPAWLLEIGQTGLALTVTQVQAGAPVPDAARLAEESYRRAWQAGESGAVVPLSDLLAWQGQNRGARDVLVAALTESADDATAMARLQNLGSNDAAGLVTDLEQIRQLWPDRPLLLWYLGAAHFNHQQSLRQSGDYLKAHQALDRAEENFLAAMNLEPQYQESCQQYLHLCRCARGWALREEGRSPEAAQVFQIALETAPHRLEGENQPGTLRLGIYAVVDDAMRAGDLKAVVAFLSRITAVHDANPDWQNNLGFASRDFGVLLLQQGKEEEAQDMFERSWLAYSRCVEIAGADARLINDRALISVYYLDHSWELAERELHRAIEVGVPALQALPAETSLDDRQNAEEAVGDAWENLAYLDVVRRGRLDRAEEFLANSVAYFPYEEGREGVRRIRQAMDRLKAARENPPAKPGD
ncbi:MAG: hypothetical protein DWQ01_15375 [Planctomycetota bacterium]|nr:MAG: hypothetical protein DWQ01_15375 [Planctomycetota bacterium]